MTAPTYQWQPTTAQIAARYGLRTGDVVRFDHNTSPYSTEWAAGIVAPIAQHLNEYPAASYAELRASAARYYGTDPDRIVPGAGIDEILLLVAKAFLGPGRRACAAVPTYPLYEIATLQHGAEFRSVPYEAPGFAFPARAIGEAAETSDVTWLCIPNNPTGHRIDDDELATVLRDARGLVILDAAYAEFSGDWWAPWVATYDNLIVCHTLSKGFGLAGLRVGFAMAAPDLIAALDGVRPPGSITTLSAEIAKEALRSPQRMQRHVERILKERSRLAESFARLGIGVVPGSDTNFLLCEVGEHAADLAERLAAEGLVVRQFPADGPIGGFLRFTVRSRAEDDRLIDALGRHLT